MAIEPARIVVGAGLAAAFVFAMTLALAPQAPAQVVPPPPSVFPGQPYVTGAPVVYQPPLDYPREARERGREGTVVVAFLVNEKGEVERFRIVEADPPLIFDSAVNAAVPSFRFAPAMRNGKPSSYETRLTLSFKPQGRDGPK
jgi:periplasmic protein TonB